jgi:hypothetical protein
MISCVLHAASPYLLYTLRQHMLSQQYERAKNIIKANRHLMRYVYTTCTGTAVRLQHHISHDSSDTVVKAL